MASALSFGQDERPLFQHKCTHSNQQGRLIVTDLKVCFISDNQQLAPIQILLSSIDKLKYSPMNDPKGRVMVMIQTVLQSPPHVFQFVGETSSCQLELERLKAILVQLRSADSKGTNHSNLLPPINGSASSSDGGRNLPSAATHVSVEKSSEQNFTPSSSTSNSKSNNSIAQSRKALLEADKHLATKYRDLVLNDRILTDEEFWADINGVAINGKSISDSSYYASVKGKSTSLFADVEKTFKNGKLSINLTTEHKEHIFLMYPAVRTAFLDEVPLRQTEAEFWQSYFQSEYYNRDKGTSEGENLLINQSHLDRLLYDYEAVSKTHLKSSQSNQVPAPEHRKLEGLVSPSIDLTATFGDYRPSERLSQLLPIEDRYNNTDFVDESQAFYQARVVEKYNRHSKLLMSDTDEMYNVGSNKGETGRVKQTDPTALKTTRGHEDNQNSQDSTDLEELHFQEPPEQKYIPLHINSATLSQQATSGESTNVSNSGGFAIASPLEENLEEDGVNAFGAFGKRKSTSFSPISPQSKQRRVHDDQFNIDPNEISSTIHTIFPTEENSLQYQRTVNATLREASQLKDAGSGILPSKTQEFLTQQTAFAQEMLELYTSTSELLRHFYAMLERTVLDPRTTEGREGCARVEKLVSRFFVVQEKLDLKLKNIESSVNQSVDKSVIQACADIISDVKKILTRAQNKWSDYKQTFD